MTINDHIDTIQNQIDYFTKKLEARPKDAKTQATFWTLRYKSEELLAYLHNPSAPRGRALSATSSKINILILEFLRSHDAPATLKAIKAHITEKMGELPRHYFKNRIMSLKLTNIIEGVAHGYYRLVPVPEEKQGEKQK